MSNYKKIPVKKINKELSEPYLENVEEFLFSFFNKPQTEKKEEIRKLLNSNPEWPLPYQLSMQREHILDWYDFDKDKTLLDVGAGCGALTGMFSSKVKNVVCLEPTTIRAKVISKRWADKKNIEIINGIIESLDKKRKFDYINLTGVLEYVGKYSKDFLISNFEKSPEIFLNNIKSHLKPDGILFIAIENPLGVRYISGAVEDHYGELYEGVEYYPQYNGIRTFSLQRITSLLESTGYKIQDIYLPFPDYKLPKIVLNLEYLTNLNANSLSSLFLNNEFSKNPLYSMFSEIPFAYQLNQEEIIHKFANSFLLIAQNTQR